LSTDGWEGREQRYADVMAELSRLGLDLIIAPSPPAALAAKGATGSVPVLFFLVGDPVALGLVDNLARPGGNMTGISFDVTPEIAPKRAELLREIAPTVSRVAVLWSSADPVGIPALRQIETAAPSLNMTIRPFDVRSVADLEGAFSTIRKDRLGAILVQGGPITVAQRGRIIEFANASHLPTIFWSKVFVDSGGLVSYGASLSEHFQRAALYVDKILKGGPTRGSADRTSD
jgi:putative ABC transport system substrate-binding protein